MADEHRRLLHILADRLGIVREYIDQSGRECRQTSDETRVALLAAMGVDASNTTRAREALDRLEREAKERLVAPVLVARGATSTPATVEARVPARTEIRYTVAVTDERDVTHEHGGTAKVHEGRAQLELPRVHDVGYYTVHVELRTRAKRYEARQLLIVSPERCLTPAERLGGGARVFGLTANLYSVRSARNWGVGDFSDLAELARWGGSRGAAFVGVNPLHALHDRGMDVSPYSPITRLWRNVIYIDVDRVPEVAELEGDERPSDAELDALRDTKRVRYDEIIALKRRVLDAAFEVFRTHHRDGDTPRGEAFREFSTRHGGALEDFATWMALSESFAGDAAGGRDWHQWPGPYRDPASVEVAAFRASHRDRIDLHRWLQFVADEQLAGCAGTARDAGMSLGVYQDLAVASSSAGSDAWAYQSLFARGVALGAPPDMYAEQGQNWGLPPLDPWALRNDAYRYWIRLVRSAFRHAGALRIDHILGCFRQFWIPEGKTGQDGAYVRFPTDDLFAILALESRRANALVVGEDLGTVPKEVPETLRDWSILSSKVLQFEREGDAAYKPCWTYEPLSLTTANTHDMATIAGFWQGRDLAIRREVGLTKPDEYDDAVRDREKEKHRLLERLAADGALPNVHPPRSGAELRGAVHSFLCRTNAALVGISLDDLAGEVEPVNVPGVGGEEYPSWTRRMAMPLEELETSPDVRAALRCEDRGMHG